MASGRERATRSAAALAFAAGLPRVLVQPRGAPFSVDGDRSLVAGRLASNRRIVRRRFRVGTGGHVRARIAGIVFLLISYFPLLCPAQRKFVRLRVRLIDKNMRLELERMLQVGRQAYNRVLWFMRARTAMRWIINAQVCASIHVEYGSHSRGIDSYAVSPQSLVFTRTTLTTTLHNLARPAPESPLSIPLGRHSC